MPHFRERGPESIKVPGMGLWLCGPQVRESRRLLVLHLVWSHTVAELGLHHQQCNLSFCSPRVVAPLIVEEAVPVAPPPPPPRVEVPPIVPVLPVVPA
ncbi:hypothetical protein Taro_011321 [Colocasia esculenta]|uniref:Uncharacterized protein n=1 Tax=Colocasia esculenta TaxID=4460 RepID=A0A843U5Z4_COLES|nr:hypothetical protein [Colocasia esculenta]